MKRFLLIALFAAFLFGGIAPVQEAQAKDVDNIITLQDAAPDKEDDKDKDKDKKSCCDKDKKSAEKKSDCDKKSAAKKSDCDKKTSKAPCKSKSSPDQG
ncbi:MAG: hypothetical protein ACQESX_00075 [Bacteroidota bacterium]